MKANILSIGRAVTKISWQFFTAKKLYSSTRSLNICKHREANESGNHFRIFSAKKVQSAESVRTVLHYLQQINAKCFVCSKICNKKLLALLHYYSKTVYDSLSQMQTFLSIERWVTKIARKSDLMMIVDGFLGPERLKEYVCCHKRQPVQNLKEKKN